MEVHNLSLHATSEFNLNTRVYIALDAPSFETPSEFAQWRSCVTQYVNDQWPSLDKKKDADKNYSVVYVPEAVTEATGAEDAQTTPENVLFITKRPDPFDGDDYAAAHLEVPGNHTVIVMHDLGNIIPKHFEAPAPDVVSHSMRILGYTFAFFTTVIGAMHVLRNNPFSTLGM